MCNIPQQFTDSTYHDNSIMHFSYLYILGITRPEEVLSGFGGFQPLDFIFWKLRFDERNGAPQFPRSSPIP
jgi:hypothetical protein